MLAIELLTIIFCLTLPQYEVQSASRPDCNISLADGLVAAKSGSFIIGGLFQISKGKYCTSDANSFMNIQKAIFLRHLIDKVGVRFEKDFNKSLGYELYDTCSRHALAMRSSTRLSQNDLVVGVAGVDSKDLIKETALQTTAYHIPTFSYIFNDDDLMDSFKFPTLFSLTDTEVSEAKITIQFLNLMKFRYMDIWYHPFSKQMAEYIYHNYTLSYGGCGRMAEIHKSYHVLKIDETFEKTGGTPSDVQLILSNNFMATRFALKHMVNDLKFRDKIYILGYSVGREKYLETYKSIVTYDLAGNSSLIFPIPDLSNSQTETENIQKILNVDWSKMPVRDRIDEIYAEVLSKRMAEGKRFLTSNWLPHLKGGFELIIQSLYENVKDKRKEIGSCPLSFRQDVYKTIIKENRTIHIDDPFLSADLKLTNKSLNSGYIIGVYQSFTGKYEVLGRAFPNSINITNEDLLQKISIYKRKCSTSCPPGYYRLFEDQTLKYLPCCWTCAKCPLNHYSTKYDQNFCEICDASEASTKDMIGCMNTTETYIKRESSLFIIGSTFAPIGLSMVIVCGVVIFANEDRPIIKASDPGYLYTVLLSIGIAYIGSFIPLMKPSSYTCTAEYFTFVIFATIITINLLFKCVKIYDIFAASKNFRRPKLGKLLKKSGQTALNIAALALNISLLLIDNYNNGGLSWRFYRIQYDPHTPWQLLCDVSHLEYIALPVIIPTVSFLATLWLALKMRRFPHNFRETLNIFAATFIVLLCSVMFLGGYAVSPSSIRSFLRSLVLQITASAFLTCLFIPKIVLLLRKQVDLEKEKSALEKDVRKFSSKVVVSHGRHSSVRDDKKGEVYLARSSSTRIEVNADIVTMKNIDELPLNL